MGELRVGALGTPHAVGWDFIRGQPLKACAPACEEMRIHFRQTSADMAWRQILMACCEGDIHPATGVRGW